MHRISQACDSPEPDSHPVQLLLYRKSEPVANTKTIDKCCLRAIFSRKGIIMQRVFKEVLNILNQNEIFHHVSRESAAENKFDMFDIYTVLLDMEMQDTSDCAKEKLEKSSETYGAYPILQIAYCSGTKNLRIFFDGECIYNKENFAYKAELLGYSKNIDASDDVFTKILDVCIKKSTKTHLNELKRLKKVLAQQSKGYINAR